MCVERLESFTKLLTAENHCANSRKTATWAGGFTFNPGYLFLQIYQEPKNDGECLYNIKEFLKGCTSFRVEVSPPFLQIFEVNGALLPHPCVYFLTPKWRLWMCSVYRTRARWDPGTVNNGSMELLTGGGGGNTAENNHTSAPRKITVAAAAALNSILHLCSSPFHLRSIIFSETLHSTGFSSTIQAFFLSLMSSYPTFCYLPERLSAPLQEYLTVLWLWENLHSFKQMEDSVSCVCQCIEGSLNHLRVTIPTLCSSAFSLLNLQLPNKRRSKALSRWMSRQLKCHCRIQIWQQCLSDNPAFNWRRQPC